METAFEDKGLFWQIEKANGKMIAVNGGTMDIVFVAMQTFNRSAEVVNLVWQASGVQLIPGLTANLRSVRRIRAEGVGTPFNSTTLVVRCTMAMARWWRLVATPTINLTSSYFYIFYNPLSK